MGDLVSLPTFDRFPAPDCSGDGSDLPKVIGFSCVFTAASTLPVATGLSDLVEGGSVVFLASSFRGLASSLFGDLSMLPDCAKLTTLFIISDFLVDDKEESRLLPESVEDSDLNVSAPVDCNEATKLPNPPMDRWGLGAEGETAGELFV